MTVSVIIPTFNRAAILAKTLQAYAEQTGDHRICEILVVDDGSVDETRAVVELAAKRCGWIRYLHQANQGLAAARNHGIREASGELLLFGDDDIIPSGQLTAEHVSWQDRHPEGNCGVLGHVAWWPEVRPTPFMRWSGLYGPQFNFGNFKDGEQLGYQFGYCCNWSVYASFLRENGIFSEAFRTYGYEDIELTYRLQKKGYRHFYNQNAIGYHNKYETCGDAVYRVKKLYQSWPEFAKTEAGQAFLDMWQQSKSSVKRSITQKILAPFKPIAVPVLKPLLDTHIPLPRWTYEQIFYYYVPSFASVVAAAQ